MVRIAHPKGRQYATEGFCIFFSSQLFFLPSALIRHSNRGSVSETKISFFEKKQQFFFFFFFFFDPTARLFARKGSWEKA